MRNLKSLALIVGFSALVGGCASNPSASNLNCPLVMGNEDCTVPFSEYGYISGKQAYSTWFFLREAQLPSSNQINFRRRLQNILPLPYNLDPRNDFDAPKIEEFYKNQYLKNVAFYKKNNKFIEDFDVSLGKYNFESKSFSLNLGAGNTLNINGRSYVFINGDDYRIVVENRTKAESLAISKNTFIARIYFTAIGSTSDGALKVRLDRLKVDEALWGNVVDMRR